MAMTRSQLAMVVTLPWLAAGVVLLAMTRIDGETQEAKFGLFGSAAICFSIGCLARTSLCAIASSLSRNTGGSSKIVCCVSTRPLGHRVSNTTSK